MSEITIFPTAPVGNNLCLTVAKDCRHLWQLMDVTVARGPHHYVRRPSIALRLNSILCLMASRASNLIQSYVRRLSLSRKGRRRVLQGGRRRVLWGSRRAGGESAGRPVASWRWGTLVGLQRQEKRVCNTQGMSAWRKLKRRPTPLTKNELSPMAIMTTVGDNGYFIRLLV